jgi:hypothetical protein
MPAAVVRVTDPYRRRHFQTRGGGRDARDDARRELPSLSENQTPPDLPRRKSSHSGNSRSAEEAPCPVTVASLLSSRWWWLRPLLLLLRRRCEPCGRPTMCGGKNEIDNEDQDICLQLIQPELWIIILFYWQGVNAAVAGTPHALISFASHSSCASNSESHINSHVLFSGLPSLTLCNKQQKPPRRRNRSILQNQTAACYFPKVLLFLSFYSTAQSSTLHVLRPISRTPHVSCVYTHADYGEIFRSKARETSHMVGRLVGSRRTDRPTKSRRSKAREHIPG